MCVPSQQVCEALKKEPKHSVGVPRAGVVGVMFVGEEHARAPDTCVVWGCRFGGLLGTYNVC